MILRRISLATILFVTVLLSACGAGYEWSRASTLNTIPAYRKFLSKYPADSHVIEARSRIATIQDERAWTTAQIASSVQGYQQYLIDEPHGAHVQVSRDEIAARERDAAWQTARTSQTPQSLRNFINSYPSSAEADEARDQLKAIAGYRAELGTARSERLADRKRDHLAMRFGKDLRQVVVLGPDANERNYRVTSAPMSEQDASAACKRLTRIGGSCKVVQVAS